MVNIIQRKSLEIPLIIMGILVLSSFVPIIQIVILTLNGAILSPLYAIASNDKVAIQYIYFFNFLTSFFGLVLFFRASKISLIILSAIFSVLFLLPLATYIFGMIVTDLYFVQNLVSGFVVGLILLIVALLKQPVEFVDRGGN